MSSASLQINAGHSSFTNEVSANFSQLLSNKAFWILLFLLSSVTLIVQSLHFHVYRQLAERDQRTKLSGDYDNFISINYFITLFFIISSSILLLYTIKTLYMYKDV